MRTAKWLVLAGMAVLLLAMGCDKQMGFVDPQQGDEVRAAVLPPMTIQYNPGGSWFLYFWCTPSDAPGQTFLISIGQDNGATGSTVKIWKDETAQKIYAEFHTTGNWYIVQAHFDVATTKDGLAHNKSGNLMPGQFKGQTNNSIPYPQTTVVEVPWTGPWDQELAMAALCYVCQGEIREGDNGPYWYYWNFNTGCGGETPYKVLSLPTYPVWMTGSKVNYPRSYWDIWLSGIGNEAPYNVWDGEWVGWCYDLDNSWHNSGTPEQVILRNALDPALPSLFRSNWYTGKPIYWDRIAYLINTYSGDNWKHWSDLYPGQEDHSYVGAMEAVIYYEAGYADKPDWVPAKTWAEDADQNGNGWLPYAGSWVPVICEPYPNRLKFQLIFIEVDP